MSLDAAGLTIHRGRRRSGRRSRGALRTAVLAAAVVAAVLSARDPAVAHVPHDTIGTVAVSPDFASDQAVLAVVRQRLMSTADRGASWHEVVNGIEGEILQTLAYDPNDAQTVLLGTAFGGVVHRSTDGGQSWVQSNTGLALFRVTGFAWSPSMPGVVLASGGAAGVARSIDGGITWAAVGGFGHVDALSFAPSGTALAGDDSGRLWESPDGGATWSALYDVPGGAAILAVASATNSADETILVGTDSGELFRSIDGGASFAPVGAGFAAQPIQSIVLSTQFAVDDTAWLSLRDDGVHTSTDGGVSWSPTNQGVTTNDQAMEVGLPQFRDIAVGADGPSPVLFLAGYDGLFRSLDSAATWQEQHTLVDHLVGIAVSPDYANDQTLVVTSYVKGAYVSTDGGATWEHAHVGLGAPRGGGNLFAAVLRLYGAAASPDFALDSTLFAAGPNRLAVSPDGGGSWDPVMISQSDPALVPVVGVSPGFATDQTILVGSMTGDIHRSSQGGTGGWQLISNVGSKVQSMVFSPAFATDATVFAGTVEGVSRSTDGGTTWSPVGPTGVAAQVAVSPGFDVDQAAFAATSAGLHRTTDGGTTWSVVVSASLTPTSRVEAVEVSPNYAIDGVVLVSVAEGLLKSTDGGATFAPLAPDLLAGNTIIADFDNPTSTPIAFSPDFATDQTIFAYGQQQVVKSTDGGATWSTLTLPPGVEMLSRPEVSGSPAAPVVEPGAGGTALARIPIDLEHPAVFTVTVDWSTVDSVDDPNLASSTEGDFVADSGTLTFFEGDTRHWIEITVNDDGIAELAEELEVALSNPVNATISGTPSVEIIDDEALPAVKPFGVVVSPEGDTGSTIHGAVVQLSHPSSTPVTVDYVSVDVPANPAVAMSGTDYVGPLSGTLSFAAGEVSQTVAVEVLGDTIDEPPLLWGEWGVLQFSNPSVNSTLDMSVFGLAFIIIIDDD